MADSRLIAAESAFDNTFVLLSPSLVAVGGGRLLGHWFYPIHPSGTAGARHKTASLRRGIFYSVHRLDHLLDFIRFSALFSGIMLAYPAIFCYDI